MRIFVSYARINRAIVEPWVIDPLKKAGYSDVWFDGDIAGGQDWQNKLQYEINRCDIFIFCMSPESVKSKWCNWELDQAIALNKYIIPVLLQSNTKTPAQVQKYHFVDFSGGTTSELVRAINKFQQSNQNPSPTPTPAPLPNNMPKADKWTKTQTIIGLFALMATIIGIIIAIQREPGPSPIDEPTVIAVTTQTATSTDMLIDEISINANPNPTNTPPSTQSAISNVQISIRFTEDWFLIRFEGDTPVSLDGLSLRRAGANADSIRTPSEDFGLLIGKFAEPNSCYFYTENGEQPITSSATRGCDDRRIDVYQSSFWMPLDTVDIFWNGELMGSCTPINALDGCMIVLGE